MRPILINKDCNFVLETRSLESKLHSTSFIHFSTPKLFFNFQGNVILDQHVYSFLQNYCRFPSYSLERSLTHEAKQASEFCDENHGLLGHELPISRRTRCGSPLDSFLALHFQLTNTLEQRPETRATTPC